MHLKVLGSLRAGRVLPDGEIAWLDVGARKPRSILAALALRPGRPVAPDLLTHLVWAGEPPRAAHATLHSYLSGLRRVLEPDRPARGTGSVLETTDHGYVLHVDPADVDAHRFADEVRAGERLLAPLVSQFSTGPAEGWPSRAEVAEGVDRLDAALGTWVGQPYADLPDHPDLLAERASLGQLRAAAEEARLLGLLALGEHSSVLSTTETATAAEPLRERLWALHALALTRAGRQAEALQSLRTIRELLADELGLDPGAELRELEGAILRQDGALLDGARTAPTRTAEASPAPPRTAEPAPSPSPADDGTRAEERAALHALLDTAEAGRACSGVLVGEPGIGKSWLLDDLVREATRRGFVVGVGQCSQDDGAPPLWPWLGVLRGMGDITDVGHDVSLPDLAATSDESPGRLAFRTWDGIARTVLAAAATAPVLVVLDDLHWADDATLRTLRHLLATAPTGCRLAVVVSRRAHPEPTGALLEVGEQLARAHATRLDVCGLDDEDSRRLVRSLRGYDVEPQVAAELQDRSGGNPFFLVELARLEAGAASDVPATVRDVLARRLAALPPHALDTLRTAAVIGRRFLVEAVAAAGATDPDEVAEDLEAARAAGLVEDLEPGHFAFAHALTRDAVYLGLPPTRRARLHAVVAHALESDDRLRQLLAPDELTAELAQHWLAAGPSHAERAWRAASAAADQAQALSAYAVATRLRHQAVIAHRSMPGGDPEDRYDLLIALGRAANYAAQWDLVVEAAFEAMTLARSMGRPERVGEAAAGLTRYCVWTPHGWLEVFEDAIDDLRWALAALPAEDSAERCTLLLALAVELYYDGEAVEERAALIDTGLALARRLDDPALLWWATRAAWIAGWQPSRTPERLHWAEEGLAAARRAGDRAAEAVSLLALATDRLELLGPDAWDGPSAEAERIAAEERLPYVSFTCQFVELNLSRLRGDAEEAARRERVLLDLAPEVSLVHGEIQPLALRIVTGMWSDGIGEFVDVLPYITAESSLGWPFAHAILARAGRTDLLVRDLATQIYVEPAQTWQTLMSFCFEAEAALATGDVALARRSADVLAPYAGRMALAGVAMVVGPVDGYLALAAATYGDLDAARHHAERAAELADQWRIPVYAEWLRRHRGRLGI